VALKNGVNEGNVEVVLPVINKKFSIARNLDKLAVRKKLSLPLDKKIILVVAGGDGLYRGGEIVKNLVNLPDDFRVLVVCGREKKFYEQAVCEYDKHPDKILLVVGFVDNIED
jgi:UDP-N-acetylglucosamine:LPS N-acetylglucosamine transferase